MVVVENLSFLSITHYGVVWADEVLDTDPTRPDGRDDAR